jgi:hypothetical protein
VYDINTVGIKIYGLKDGFLFVTFGMFQNREKISYGYVTEFV